jgi:N-acetylglutamate synthase-like GNAT family acetyltransferase
MNPLGLDPSRFLVAHPPTDDSDLLCVGQLKQLKDGLYEVASLVAAPAARGAGLGGDLLSRLVATAPPGSTVCLTTTSRRAPFYERAGFRRVGLFSRRELWLEAAAGSVVAPLAAGDRLIVMEATTTV